MKKFLLIFLTIAIVAISSVCAVAKESYKLGDVDNDGVVSVRDATQIQLYLVGLNKGNENFKKLADVDGDGKVSVIDSTSIQQYLVNLIDKFPGEDVTEPTKTTDSDGYYDQIIKP